MEPKYSQVVLWLFRRHTPDYFPWTNFFEPCKQFLECYCWKDVDKLTIVRFFLIFFCPSVTCIWHCLTPQYFTYDTILLITTIRTHCSKPNYDISKLQEIILPLSIRHLQMNFTNYLLQHVAHKHIGSQICNKKACKVGRDTEVSYAVNISMATVVRNANFGRIFPAILSLAEIRNSSHFSHPSCSKGLLCFIGKMMSESEPFLSQRRDRHLTKWKGFTKNYPVCCYSVSASFPLVIVLTLNSATFPGNGEVDTCVIQESLQIDGEFLRPSQDLLWRWWDGKILVWVGWVSTIM